MKKCKICSQHFEPPFRRYAFCSPDCYNRYLVSEGTVGEKVVYRLKGDNNPTWKGGVSRHKKINTERHSLMGRAAYKKWRDSVFKRDNYTCQICDVYGGHLHADHIKSWKHHPELRTDTSNGRTLCVPCHYYVTFKRKMPVGVVWCNFLMTRERG